MELKPMLTPREKSPLPKMSPEEDRTRDAVDSEPKHYQLSYSGPVFGNNNNNNRIQRRYSRFFTISSQRRELSPTRTLKWPRRNRVQITRNTSSAYHVQYVMLRATWCERTAQLLSLTELKSHLFELYFVG